MIVSGELSYLGAGSFDRRVTAPYRESTEIRGQSVRVAREGEPPRTFALKRAPELGGLLTSFVALLSGDAAAVAREFSVVAIGDEGAWALELAPLDGTKRRRLQQILASGMDDELKCLAVLTLRRRSERHAARGGRGGRYRDRRDARNSAPPMPR